MPELDWTDMPIHLAVKADWKTPEILIEGSLNCAKSTVFIDKEIDALLKWPGIKTLLFRWSQDAVDTKLKPAFDEVMAIRGLSAAWDGKQHCYTFDNGSVAYMFGLKAVSLVEQYNKIRGLGVFRVAGDQIEEMAQPVAGELRGRLRPTLKATMAGLRFPFQLTFVSNCEDTDFWLSKEFPLDNHIKGRRVFSLSVFDNKHLPQESVDSLLRQYPPEHPKHQTMVLGKRGPNITGVPVYEGLYDREHHQGPVESLRHLPFYESFEVGKHNPTYVLAQPLYAGGLSLIGGIRAEELALEDFLAVVKNYRQTWMKVGAKILTCTSPLGDKDTSVRFRFTGLEILRQAGFMPIYQDNGNAHDVRLALIETIAGYLRRRTLGGRESLILNNDPSMWLVAGVDGIRESAFMHIAFEAGYTWSKHFASVSNKEVKQPTEDDKFSNAMHCVENIVLNFCASSVSLEQQDARASAGRERSRQQSLPPTGGKAPWMI